MIKQAAIALLLTATAATAQNNECGPRDVVIERLASKYGETRHSIGIGGRGVVMETFANAETGTWTITVTTPNGLTCLIAYGQSYERVADVVTEGDPT